MTCFSCENKGYGLGLAVIVSAVVGVAAILLQLTGVIAVGEANVGALFFVAVGFLALAFLTTALTRPRCGYRPILTALLVGVLGTIALSSVFLLWEAALSAIVEAILVGILLAFAALIVASAVCFIRHAVTADD